MSVINKVLRDLDNHAAAERLPAVGHPVTNPGAQMPPGVVAVPPVPVAARQGRTRRGWLVPVLLATALVAGLTLWWWQRGGGADTDPLQPVATFPMASPPAAAPVAARPVDMAPAPAPESAGAPAAVASEALFPPGVARPEVLAPLAVSPPVPANALPAPGVRQAQPAPTPPASAALREAGTVPAPAPVPAPVPAPAPKPAPVQVPPVVLPTPVPWPEAALDAVSQAQRMWATGARDTALAFLRDALAGVERAHGSDLAPDRAGAAAGLAMVRELVRMEQVMANHAQVLVLLKRHEVLWARQADLWAVRGSVAQRLSQHAEAAESYRTALRLRPGEPRWMLGAAVSLAAMGQHADAAQLAEQARRIGPVSPEVLSYLRQLGVPLASDNPAN